MGHGLAASLFLLTSGCLCLICLRKLHSSIGFPFHVCIDNVDNYAAVGRRLKSEMEVVSTISQGPLIQAISGRK